MFRKKSPEALKRADAYMARTRYINPLTDYGFKALLGVKNSKDLLIKFLNDLLEGERTITDVLFIDKEFQGATKFNRSGIFDILCEDTEGFRFIIEMQRVHQKYFKDRAVFYTSSHIHANAPRGKIEGKN